jgi:hypothetical protein
MSAHTARLIALGMFSLAAQHVILRAFIVLCGGAELTVSVFYAAWLFWVAVGAYIARTIPAMMSASSIIEAIYPWTAYVATAAVVFGKQILGIDAWETVPLTALAGIAFIAPAILSVMTGIIFVAITKTRHDHNPASASFAAESCGSILGGGIVFLLAWYGTSTLWLLAATLIAYSMTHPIHRIKRTLTTAIITCGIAVFCGSFYERTVASNFGTPASTLDTPQHLLQTFTHGNELTVTANGTVLTHLPPTIEDIRTARLLTVMTAAKPLSIAVAGSGAEALASAMHDLSPKSVITSISTDRTYRRLTGIRTESIDLPPQTYFAHDNARSYDRIIVALGKPSSLAMNSLVTQRAFEDMMRHLTPNGVLIIILSQETDALTPEMRAIGASIIAAAKIFPKRHVIAGKSHLFLFSRTSVDLSTSREPNRDKALTDEYIHASASANTTDRPYAYLGTILTTLRSSGIDPIPLSTYVHKALSSAARSILIVFVIVLIITAKLPRHGNAIAHAAFQTAAGAWSFCGFFVVLTFSQTAFGTMYAHTAALNAAFMAGLAAGSFAGRHFNVNGTTLPIYHAFASCILAAATVCITPRASIDYAVASSVMSAMFGILGGLAYPIAEKALSASSLELCDHLGAAVAAIVIPLLLVPFCGITSAYLLILLIMTACTLVMIVVQRDTRAMLLIAPLTLGIFIAADIRCGNMPRIPLSEKTVASTSQSLLTQEQPMTAQDRTTITRITQRIREGTLSDQEAMFYRQHK